MEVTEDPMSGLTHMLLHCCMLLCMHECFLVGYDDQLYLLSNLSYPNVMDNF